MVKKTFRRSSFGAQDQLDADFVSPIYGEPFTDTMFRGVDETVIWRERGMGVNLGSSLCGH